MVLGTVIVMSLYAASGVRPAVAQAISATAATVEPDRSFVDGSTFGTIPEEAMSPF